MSVHPSVMEGQQKSVDPKSKASTSLDRVTRSYRRGAIEGAIALPTGKSTRPLGM